MQLFSNICFSKIFLSLYKTYRKLKSCALSGIPDAFLKITYTQTRTSQK
nr:MAG TPA: hypothetical protein [Caudoviricetes sp.]